MVVNGGRCGGILSDPLKITNFHLMSQPAIPNFFKRKGPSSSSQQINIIAIGTIKMTKPDLMRLNHWIPLIMRIKKILMKERIQSLML